MIGCCDRSFLSRLSDDQQSAPTGSFSSLFITWDGPAIEKQVPLDQKDKGYQIKPSFKRYHVIVITRGKNTSHVRSTASAGARIPMD